MEPFKNKNLNLYFEYDLWKIFANRKTDNLNHPGTVDIISEELGVNLNVKDVPI